MIVSMINVWRLKDLEAFSTAKYLKPFVKTMEAVITEKTQIFVLLGMKKNVLLVFPCLPTRKEGRYFKEVEGAGEVRCSSHVNQKVLTTWKVEILLKIFFKQASD